jgi:protein tyrosine phosphatase (PTP) superfamily phosphohydrolase (DUF442 family)
MSGRTIHFFLLAAGLIVLAGCQSCHRGDYTAARAPCCRSCYDGPLPPRVVAAPAPMPSRFPVAGPAVPNEGPRQATFVPPAPPEESATMPPATTTPPPTPPGETPPPPAANVPRRDTNRVPLPGSGGTSPSRDEPPVASVPGPAPKVEEGRDSPLPIDLPGFAIARAGVASGLKPFPDGITWLKKQGYKTVLHLRQPGEDTAASRRLFEAKGLKYLSVEASPARLSKELYEQFVKLVEDRANQPLFVYDRDGSAAGGLWYLYYRVRLRQADDKARREAQRLGLRFDDDDEEHKTTILAVQKLLESLKP